MTGSININGRGIHISNPEKLLFPHVNIRKIDYIKILIELAPYIIPHTHNRLLTTINYPDGVEGKSFFQKNIPSHAPQWINTGKWKDNQYIILDSLEALVWLGNMAALELHTPFNTLDNENKPACLIFDLDPSAGQCFDDVVNAALIVYETLISLDIKSYVKLSGATGLQIYIPVGARYDYEAGRKINHFFGLYFSRKHSEVFTIERSVKKRGEKLYFDYLQMWTGKTIITPYSPRATKNATIAAPVTWEELKRGIKPEDINMLNIKARISSIGDLFQDIYSKDNIQSLDNFVASYIK